MAYANNQNDYTTEILIDDMSGTPDNWTEDNASHSFSSGIMTVIDSSGSSGNIKNVHGVSVSGVTDILIQMTGQVTSASSGNTLVFQVTDTSYNPSVGFYRDVSTGELYIREPGAWTATGQTITAATDYEIELLVDRTAGTYDLYIDGSNIGTYDIANTADSYYAQIVFGGGSSSAQWTQKCDELIIKHTYSPVTFTPKVIMF